MAKTRKGRKVFDRSSKKLDKLRSARIAQQTAGLNFNQWIAYSCSDAGKHAAMGLGSVVLLAGAAYALPQGPAVVSGNVSISQPTAATMQINQYTNTSIINWQGYSIAANEAVRYLQPGVSSISLNRVIGIDPSYIYGLLTANGQVWVINPNGLLVGPNAKIETGSFLGSTLGISDQNFLAGNYAFTNSSASSSSTSLASIINQGSIIASNGGYVALLSPSVTNQGLIAANAGKVVLASGDAMTLNLAGNNLIGLVVDRATQDALIANSGTITANGGTVLLTARAASDILKNVVNNTGVIEARSLVRQGGTVILDGGDSGVVANSGTIDVSSAEAGAQGGSISVLGKYVGLFDGSVLNASGDAGGGTVLMGGNFHGAGPEANAYMTYVGQNTFIYADALTFGNGGKVAVWSEDGTQFYGNISAKGGPQGGDGGFVEVSGKNYLDFNGLVNTTAPMGKTGTLLLDPDDITIEHETNSLSDDAFLNNAGGVFTSPGTDDPAILSDYTINGQLGATNVTVQTSTGSILIDSLSNGAVAIAPTGASGYTLTLNSGGNISWNAGWSYTNSATVNGTGQLTLYAAGGTISGYNSGNSTNNTLTIGGGVPLLMQASAGIGSLADPVLTTGVNSLAATTATGGIYISNSGSGNITLDSLTNPITSGAVNGLSTTTSGDVQLVNSAGSISTGTAVTAVDTHTGNGNVSLVSTAGVDINAAITAGAGAVALQGDSGGTGAGGTVSIDGSGNVAGGAITLQGSNITIDTTSGVVNAGSGTVNFFASKPSETIGVGTAAGDIAISNTELGRVTAGTLVFGDASAQTGNITFKAAAPASGQNVTAGQLSTDPHATIFLDDSSGIALATGSGNVSLTAGEGGITANTANGTAEIASRGTVTLETWGPVGASGSPIQFDAVATPARIVIGQAYRPSQVYLGGLGSLDLGTISTNGGVLDVTAAGDITADDSIGTSNGNVYLTSSGAIRESGAGLVSTTGTLTTSSATGEDLEGANTVGTFNATNTGSGDIVFTNTATPLTVAAVSQTGGGYVTVNNTGAIGITGTIGTDGGAVNLVATGGVTVNNSITSGAGAITLQGDSGATGSGGVVTIGALGSVTGTGNTITLQGLGYQYHGHRQCGRLRNGQLLCLQAFRDHRSWNSRGRHSDQQHGAWPSDRRDPRLRRCDGADRKHHLQGRSAYVRAERHGGAASRRRRRNPSCWRRLRKCLDHERFGQCVVDFGHGRHQHHLRCWSPRRPHPLHRRRRQRHPELFRPYYRKGYQLSLHRRNQHRHAGDPLGRGRGPGGRQRGRDPQRDQLDLRQHRLYECRRSRLR